MAGFSDLQLKAMLHLLVHGDDTPASIADKYDYHRNSVARSLRSLRESGYVENKGKGVHRLRDDGRQVAVERLTEAIREV